MVGRQLDPFVHSKDALNAKSRRNDTKISPVISFSFGGIILPTSFVFFSTNIFFLIIRVHTWTRSTLSCVRVQII